MKTLEQITTMVEELKDRYINLPYCSREERESIAMNVLGQLKKDELIQYWNSKNCPNIATESKKYMIESIIDTMEYLYQIKWL